ncbi:MAG: triple tyrosine motif-containing protein [Ginsengibacter sp.]|jgi:ligand-binding sensor domain-containing protein
MKIICLFFILVTNIFIPSFGQNTLGLPQIINYSKNDFHAGTQTWNIGQDKRGIMYFANNEGLITFDGNYWKVYPLPNKTITRSLAIDDDDRIYVGGQGEIGFFSPDEKGILKYTSLINRIPKEQNIFADIWKIEIFHKSIFFFATDRLFEYNNNSIKVYQPPVEWKFLKKVGDRLFAQDKKKGLLEFKNRIWQPFVNNKILENVLISGIIKIGSDSLLITTRRNGFYLLNNDSLSKKYPSSQLSGNQFQILTSEEINQTEFVSGTSSEGCLIMNFHGNIIQKISTDEGLSNNNVLCVFLDKDKNLWTGLNNGISFVAYNSAIKYIRPKKENELSVYSTIIFNKQLYISTSDGAYVAPLISTNRDFSFSKSHFSLIRNTSGEIWRIDEVNHQLLIGDNYGTFVLKNNESIPVSTGTGSWLFVPTSPIYPSKNILVGTYSGLKMLEFNNNNFIDKGSINGIRESFRFLAIDNNNYIWASHPYRGIFRLKLSDDNLSFTSRLFTEKDGLPSVLENFVFKIRNKVVFATSKGIYEFNELSNKFIPSAFLSPIFKNMEVRYLHEDIDGNIWFCSGKKIGVVNFNGILPFTITYFPELTGQILSGFENIYTYDKENIFIGSEKGIIHLNYVKYAANKLQINVLLGQVKAFGTSDSLIFGGYFHQIKDSIYVQNDNDILSLPNSYSSFHFEYSSPNYGLQKNIEYSYQLKGYDKRWSEWSPKTEKDYTNLPAGKYIFNIKAHDNLGHESHIISYSFAVSPPWYHSVWANIFYLLIIVLLLYIFYKWQEKRLYLQQVKFDEEQKRLKDILQLTIEKNEKEIVKLQNEKLENEVKFKNIELADATLHLVERTDALTKVKDKLQILYKKTDNNHDVKKTLQLLDDIEKNNSNWEQFASHFNEVNNDFLKKIKNRFPALSKTDLKVCVYLQLNLSSKEIAQLMNISVRGVEIGRYRLRKKLKLNSDQSLNDFLNEVE